MRVLCLCVLCGLVLPAFALDRDAFTFTNYDLNIRVEPEQQRLAVRGKITLRNDSAVPQKHLVLQVSSTLEWRSIQLDGKTVQFVTHQYTSDIDHTGALSEAVVNLPQEVSPKGSVELQVGYEGVLPRDATRFTRIGLPEDKAKHSDWDQISRAFTAVRGIGYVAWYPVAAEAANLSEGNGVEQIVGRWQAREASSTMVVQVECTCSQQIFFSGMANPRQKEAGVNTAGFSLTGPGIDVPTFIIADYQKLMPKQFLTIYYSSGQEDPAKEYAEVASQIDPIVPAGGELASLQILALPDPDAATFVSRGMLLTPLKPALTNEAELSMVYALARQTLRSPRPWIQDGLAHYAQVAFIEKQQGRQTALNYLEAHFAALLPETGTDKTAADKSVRALVEAPDDLYLQAKAMYVWWMLHEMVGDALPEALNSYRASDDTNPAYLQRLVEKAAHRDLQWFFDDWVYHDRGLPDFRVDSVFSSPLEKGGFLVTVTVENLGNTGAEVPVILKIEGSQLRKVLEVHARSKASVRIEAASVPVEATVNDGSVPESNLDNNTYKIESSSR